MKGKSDFFKLINYKKYREVFNNSLQIDDASKSFLQKFKMNGDKWKIWKIIRNKLMNNREFINEKYSPVTKILRLLRNSERHQRNKPLDILTNKNTFGNIHTIHSLFIISCYAYLEILELWNKFY